MIVGESARREDLDVNASKRASAASRAKRERETAAR